MVKSRSNWLIPIGVLALIVGVLALAWPGVTILALVILFAVYAFLAASMQVVRAFTSARVGPVFGHLLLALIDLAAGVIAIVWPGPTALVLVLVIGIWAVFAGFTEIFAGFGIGETAGTRAMFIVGGLVSVAFGVVLFAWPGRGAFTLAVLFGIFAIVYGVAQIFTGIRVRRIGWPVPSVLREGPPEPGRA